MKIKYEFADGKISEVEVNEEIGSVILDCRRVEDNLARKERYHCYSMDAADFQGTDYADYETPEYFLMQKLENQKTREVLEKLSEVQKRRFLMYINGLGICEIARLENTSHQAICKSIDGAKKIFKKFLK